MSAKRSAKSKAERATTIERGEAIFRGLQERNDRQGAALTRCVAMLHVATQALLAIHHDDDLTEAQRREAAGLTILQMEELRLDAPIEPDPAHNHDLPEASAATTEPEED